MNTSADPPPFQNPQDSPAPRKIVPRFNTAMLLGLMALVAVVCALGMTAPGVLVTMAGILATGVVVAYAGVMVAGALVAQESRRLFAVAALVGLAVSAWGVPNAMIATYFMDRGGLSPIMAAFLWSLAVPFQHIGLSLLGGWIAVRAAGYWETKSEDAPEPSAGLQPQTDE